MSACEIETFDERSFRLKSKFFKTLDQSLVNIVKHNVQLDFWHTIEETQVDKLIRIVDEIRLSSNKVRTGLYAENVALKKRVTELEERLSHIEKGFCYGK